MKKEFSTESNAAPIVAKEKVRQSIESILRHFSTKDDCGREVEEVVMESKEIADLVGCDNADDVEMALWLINCAAREKRLLSRGDIPRLSLYNLFKYVTPTNADIDITSLVDEVCGGSCENTPRLPFVEKKYLPIEEQVRLMDNIAKDFMSSMLERIPYPTTDDNRSGNADIIKGDISLLFENVGSAAYQYAAYAIKERSRMVEWLQLW